MKNQTQQKKHKNKFLRSIIIITTLSVSIGYGRAGFALTLTETLQKYCVPKDGNGCIAGVKAEYYEETITESSGFLGLIKHYRTVGRCGCGVRTKHYDVGNRICRECIMGSFASEDWFICEPVNCPSGQYAKLISGNCPSGFYKKLITTTCPSGFAMQVWNYSTKKWTWR